MHFRMIKSATCDKSGISNTIRINETRCQAELTKESKIAAKMSAHKVYQLDRSKSEARNCSEKISLHKLNQLGSL